MSQSGFDDEDEDEKSGYIIFEVDPIEDYQMSTENDTREENDTDSDQIDNMIEIDILDDNYALTANSDQVDASYLQQQRQLYNVNEYMDYDSVVSQNVVYKRCVTKDEKKKSRNVKQQSPSNNFSDASQRDYLREYFTQRLIAKAGNTNNIDKNELQIAEHPVGYKSQPEQIILNNQKGILHNYLSHGVDIDVNYLNEIAPQRKKKRYVFTCAKCGESFDSKQHLTEHAKIHHDTYKCKKCGQTFNTINYAIHVANNACNLKCNTCGEEFEDIKELKIHLKTHGFKCDKCGKMYKTSGSLWMHKRQKHSNLHDVKCEICGKIFNKYYLNYYHMKSHNDCNFKCQICGKAFKTEDHLAKHISITHGNKRFDCEICGKTFKGQQYMLIHKKHHYNNFNAYECEMCGKLFESKGSIKSHIKQGCHNDYFKCNTCGKEFNTQFTFSMHIKAHIDSNDFNCQLCGKSFKSRISLGLHKRVHN